MPIVPVKIGHNSSCANVLRLTVAERRLEFPRKAFHLRFQSVRPGEADSSVSPQIKPTRLTGWSGTSLPGEPFSRVASPQ